MMKRLRDLFEISRGNKLDFNKMIPLSRAAGGINFIGRSSQGHGSSGSVAPIDGIEPYHAGLITVSLGGMKPLSSFVQPDRFYTAQNVDVLRPRQSMTSSEMTYVCMCIRENRFRYSSHGREANRTLRDLLIPDISEFPDWARETDAEVSAVSGAPQSKEDTPPLNLNSWGRFRIGELFQIKKGKRLTKANRRPGTTPFLGAIAGNNGVSAWISAPPRHPGNTITINYNGSIGETFYQPQPFYCSDDVNVLYPNFTLSPALGIFLVTIIRHEKYRFNFGRKWTIERMVATEIYLPKAADGQPDWGFMESFVLTLPFSAQV